MLEERLKQVPPFDALSEPQLMALALVAKERQLADGELVFEKGDQNDGLYFVVAGAVRVGETSTVEAGGFFGVQPLTDDRPRAERALAAGKSRVLLLPRVDSLKLLVRFQHL